MAPVLFPPTHPSHRSSAQVRAYQLLWMPMPMPCLASLFPFPFLFFPPFCLRRVKTISSSRNSLMAERKEDEGIHRGPQTDRLGGWVIRYPPIRRRRRRGVVASRSQHQTKRPNNHQVRTIIHLFFFFFFLCWHHLFISTVIINWFWPIRNVHRPLSKTGHVEGKDKKRNETIIKRSECRRKGGEEESRNVLGTMDEMRKEEEEEEEEEEEKRFKNRRSRARREGKRRMGCMGCWRWNHWHWYQGENLLDERAIEIGMRL